jgi:DNA-binding transcriptional regulator YhcF (GntR family)
MKNDGENRRNGTGFIKLSRRLLEWEWIDDPSVLVVWIHCLLAANWKDYRYHGEVIPRGSFLTSSRSFAERCNLSERTVRRCFEKLEKSGEIERQVTHRGTLVKVRNYAAFQDSENGERRTAVRTPVLTPVLTADQQEKNIRSKEVKKNTKKKFFSHNRSEALPEYYSAEPIRNPNPEPATPEEVEALRKQLQKGKEK